MQRNAIARRSPGGLRVAADSITEICTFTVKEDRKSLSAPAPHESQAKIAGQDYEEIRSRLQFLMKWPGYFRWIA